MTRSHGWQRTSIYDPAPASFSDMQDMAHGRWYPTPTELSEWKGCWFFSGLDENGNTNPEVEIYKVASGWSTPYTAPGFLLCIPECIFFPTVTFFIQAGARNPSISSPPPTLGSGTIATTNYGGKPDLRLICTSPFDTGRMADAPKVMIFGGGNPATARPRSSISLILHLRG